jgi:hypothetical protein
MAEKESQSEISMRLSLQTLELVRVSIGANKLVVFNFLFNKAALQFKNYQRM